MANWKQFKRSDGGKVWVNLDRALYIATDPENDHATAIGFPADESMLVVNSVDDVAREVQRTNP